VFSTPARSSAHIRARIVSFESQPLRQRKLLAVGSIAIAVACVTLVMLTTFVPIVRNARSVQLLSMTSAPQPLPRFNPDESAALFVGVRKFRKDDAILDVPYAADDAVDLAYLFALDPQVTRLVPPERVVLALSGAPQKEESRRRLEQLKAAGAQLEDADQSDIIKLTRQQAALAGRGGILILSFATHGFLHDGVPYLLGASSIFHEPDTAISTAKLFDDAAARSDARRSLIFVDACRERLRGDARGSGDPTTVAPDIKRRMKNVAGQVVFFAAAAGQYAYDDDQSHNGVFTKAVIDGLHCGAAPTRGVVTVATLHTFVEHQVRKWIHDHRDPSIQCAIQVNIDGSAKNMPLAHCDRRVTAAVRTVPVRASSQGPIVSLFGSDGSRMWSADAGEPVAQVAVTGERPPRVVAGIRGGHGRPGRIVIFDRDGNVVGRTEDAMPLRTFVVHDVFHSPTPRIIAIWCDDAAATSRLAIYGTDGQIVSSYEHRGRLQHLAVDRPTARHTPKIVVAGTDARGAAVILVFDPRGVQNEKPLWSGTIQPRGETIRQLELVDGDVANTREIAITTRSGDAFRVKFATGEVLRHRGARSSDAELVLASAPRRRK
jgi:hypothetical protein